MNKKILKEQVRAKVQMSITENIDTGKSVDILVEGETVQINENFLRRIFSKGVKRFRLKFIEKGQNQIFFAANRQGIEWMSFVGGRLDEKGTFDSLDEAEEFIASKMKEGFKEVQNEAGIKEFMKKIKPALPKMIKIAAFGAIGVGAIILLAMTLTPGAMSILATGGMSALVRMAGGTVVDFTKDASGWIAGSFAVDATEATYDLELPDAEVTSMAPDAEFSSMTTDVVDVPEPVSLVDDSGLSREGHESLRQTSSDILDKIHDGTATPEEIQTYQSLEQNYGITPDSTFTPASVPETPSFTDDSGLSREGHESLRQTSAEIFNKIQAGTATPEEIQTYNTLEQNYGITPNSTFVPGPVQEQVRTVVQKKIGAFSGKKEQLNEMFDPLSLGVGVGAGMATFYTGLVAKRKMGEISRKVGRFFKDPFGFKRKSFEKMVKTLQELIEQRDAILSRGDDTSVRELRDADALSRQIVAHSAEMKNFLNKNIDALEIADNKRDFVELMSLLNSASSGEITFMDLKDTSFNPNR